MTKFAVKKLTGSDLTFFEWQFRNINKGNQKAINLNKDVFIDELYPSLPGLREKYEGRFPLDLTIYGPGKKGPYNLQRKITKTGTSYKNWRLNGEFVYNPEDDFERFNSLRSDDLVIFEFIGEVTPRAAKAFFVSSTSSADRGLYREADSFLDGKSMKSISVSVLERIVEAAATEEDHPIYELVLDEYLEDAAFRGAAGTKKIYERRSGTKMTREALQKARLRAEAVGRRGEELVNEWLELRFKAGDISSFVWVSNENAIAPYDFEYKTDKGAVVKLDVKTTVGSFDWILHVSTNEILEMHASDARYDIFRVYELDEHGGKMRIAEEMKGIASEILESLDILPDGVRPDSFSILPSSLSFQDEVSLNFLPEEKE